VLNVKDLLVVMQALSGVLNLIEAVSWTQRLQADPNMLKELLIAMNEVCEGIPSKHVELLRRVEKIIALLDKQSLMNTSAVTHSTNLTGKIPALFTENNSGSNSSLSNEQSNTPTKHDHNGGLSNSRLGSSSSKSLLSQQQLGSGGVSTTLSGSTNRDSRGKLLAHGSNSASSAASLLDGGNTLLSTFSVINTGPEMVSRGYRCPPIPRDR
jgi:hypothetical protein